MNNKHSYLQLLSAWPMKASTHIAKQLGVMPAPAHTVYITLEESIIWLIWTEINSTEDYSKQYKLTNAKTQNTLNLKSYHRSSHLTTSAKKWVKLFCTLQLLSQQQQIQHKRNSNKIPRVRMYKMIRKIIQYQLIFTTLKQKLSFNRAICTSCYWKRGWNKLSHKTVKTSIHSSADIVFKTF